MGIMEVEQYFLGRVSLTPLKKIFHEMGDIYHGIKASDDSFAGFGEAYFTTIKYGKTKGWKMHKRMTMNIVIPSGSVTFYIYDEKNDDLLEVTLGENNYQRLLVQPGLWVAFKGEGPELNLLLNIASIEHDPDEAINMPLDHFSTSRDQ